MSKASDTPKVEDKTPEDNAPKTRPAAKGTRGGSAPGAGMAFKPGDKTVNGFKVTRR